MKYYCESCLYRTEDRTAWHNHKKTKKHLRLNPEDDETRNMDLITKNHEVELLKERLKATENERNIYKQQLEEAKKQHEKELENTKILYEKQVRILENQTHFQEQLINCAGGVIKKSMNTLSYLLLNYNNAPHINKLDDYSIISKGMDDLINNITFYYDENKLDRYIGDFIIKQYKKNEPENQSLWSSDTDRLNYFICEIMKKQDNDNKKQWILDKKGIKMTNCIIKPLLDYISDANSNYIINKSYEIKDIEHTNQGMKILKMMQTLALVNGDIRNNKLSVNINKYIAPHFYFDKQLVINK